MMDNEQLITELLQSIKEEIHSLRKDLAEHVADEMAPQHQAGHAFVDALMLREEKRMKLWDAIIEKSLAGLIYSALAGVLVAVIAYVKAHWVM